MQKGNERSIYPLIINSNGLVNDGINNKYRYDFPLTSQFNNSKIALANVSLYYSWYNITERNNNNKFTLYWPTGPLELIFNITIPDGYYSVSTLNLWLQSFCVQNGLYLINADGDFVYYIELVENETYYSVQLNTFALPTGLPGGWSYPANGTWAYPDVNRCPQLVVLQNGLRDILGFNAGTYPSGGDALQNYSKLSDFVPQVSPVQSIIMTCSILNNKYSNPSDVIYSFTQPNDVSFGQIISSSPNEYSFIDVQNGAYSSILISFYDQNFNALYIRDTNIIITLLITE